MALTLLAACAECAPPPPEDAPVPQAWTALCDDTDAGACLADGPLACTDDGAPPAARCETCGCPGGDACVGEGENAVCASAAVRNAVRAGPDISDGLVDDDYLALYARVLDTTRPRLTLSTLATELRRQAAVDGRRAVVVIGREPGDRGEVLIDALAGEELGVEPTASCAERAAAATARDVAREEGVFALALDVGAIDDSHSALCALPGVIARCAPPHRAACLGRGGAVAPVVVVVDDDVFFERADLAMLRSVERVGRDTWEQRFDAIVAALATTALSIQPDAAFAVQGPDAEVRVVSLDHDDVLGGEVLLAWLPRFGQSPVRSLAFRTLWADAQTRQFLTDEDMVPSDCAFAPDAASAVVVSCAAANGGTLVATVDVDRAVIGSIERTPG